MEKEMSLNFPDFRKGKDRWVVAVMTIALLSWSPPGVAADAVGNCSRPGIWKLQIEKKVKNPDPDFTPIPFLVLVDAGKSTGTREYRFCVNSIVSDFPKEDKSSEPKEEKEDKSSEPKEEEESPWTATLIVDGDENNKENKFVASGICLDRSGYKFAVEGFVNSGSGTFKMLGTYCRLN